MPTPAEQAYIDAVTRDPNAVHFFEAIANGIPPEVAANPSAYGYDYGADPTGLAYQRTEAFLPTTTYDYRTEPGYLQANRGYEAQIAEANRVAARDIGNLDVLQPVTEDDIRWNREEALRQVNLNAEARGIYNSGERAMNRARTTGDYERQLAGVQLSGAIQRGNIQSDQAAQLADVERRRTDTLAQYANPPLPGGPGG